MKPELATEIHNADPNIILELYQINLKGKGEYYFHAGENGIRKKIVFNGKEYEPIAMKVNGFEYKGDGRLPRPTMLIANSLGEMSLKNMFFEDFISHKVTRIKTFIKYIDDINFPGNNNPYGEADIENAFSKDEYYVNQKIREDKYSCEYELVSILELQDMKLPGRRIMANHCSWIYRSINGCGYNDIAVADIRNKKIRNGGYDDNLIGPETHIGNVGLGAASVWSPDVNYNVGNVVEVKPYGYNESTKPSMFFVCLQDNTNSDPRFDHERWVQDECSKDLQGCRLRFGAGAPSDQEVTDGLPFGAFPGVAQFPPA